jgi:hypothetical protein
MDAKLEFEVDVEGPADMMGRIEERERDTVVGDQ